MIPYAIQDLMDIIPKHMLANAQNTRKRICPVCSQYVEPRDFITSFRRLDDGSHEPVNLCRNCRDSGK